MIPVSPAPEPENFDRTVRQPGLAAMAANPSPPSPPSFWRKATPDMMRAYHQICAYFCIYMEFINSPTIDHFIAKSRNREMIYEWSNYRLACSLANSRKRDFEDVLDPFDIPEGLFALDLITLKVVPGPHAESRREEVGRTIRRLGLDRADYASCLEDYYDAYWNKDISFKHLQRRAPFLAAEMIRQGKAPRPAATGEEQHP